VIGPFGIEWIGWGRIVGSRRVHRFSLSTCGSCAVVVSAAGGCAGRGD
jgi:hypothetical protein